MENARITKVENGFIIEVTKLDIVTDPNSGAVHRKPITEVFVESNLDEVITRLRGA